MSTEPEVTATIEIVCDGMRHRITNYPIDVVALKELAKRPEVKKYKSREGNAYKRCPSCKCCSLLEGECIGCCRATGRQP